MEFFKKLFALPPVEERRAPAWFLGIYKQKASRAISDDVYIQYLLVRTSILVALFFSLLNVLSHVTSVRFNFYFFAIDLSGPNYVKTFLHTYTLYTATIVLFLVLPFYLLLFKFHFNAKDYVPSWSSQTPVAFETMDVWKVRKTCLFMILMGCILMYGAFCLFDLFMGKLFENSYPYFLFCALAMPFVMTLGSWVVLLFTIMMWRYGRKRADN